VEIDRHGRQVAVVDAEHAVASRRKTDQAAHTQERVGLVDLHQHGQRQLRRGDHQVHQLARRQGIGDQQDRIGPGGTRFVDLPEVHDEVLSQDRNLDRLPDLLDIFEPALEILLVGQHADRIGAAALVRPGDGHWVEIGTNQSRRRRRLFDLGDHVEPAPVRLGHRLVEIAALRQTDDSLLELVKADLGLPVPHLLALIGDDLV
jgi:hypothetical protein